MKKQFIFLLTATSVLAYGQQTTLQHFDPSVVTLQAENYTGTYGGYYTGNNDYGDEEFAEKYEIQGTAILYGVSAIHLGQDGSPGSITASYRAYTVGPTGLPQAQIVNKDLPYSQIPVNGQLSTVMFNNPVNVSNNFFISFRLGDYAHGGLGTKRIAVGHTPNGTRPSSDFSVYARNVARWHSHGSAIWKDYRTEHFAGVDPNIKPAVYFALFPVLELSNLSVIDFDKRGDVGAVYPNPSSGTFKIPITTSAGGKARFKLFDMSGKLVTEKQTNLSFGKNDFIFSEERLQSGSYILFIETPEGKISQKISIR